MINLIKAELFRLYKLRSLKVVSILTWIQPVLIVLMSLFAQSSNGTMVVSNDLPNGYSYILAMTFIVINFAMPVYIIFISFFSNSDEYISNVVSRAVEASYSRKKILVSKIITEYIISFIIIIVTVILFQLLRFINITTTDTMHFDPNTLNVITRYFIYMFLGTTCSLSFLNLMYILFKKDFFVLIGYFMYFILDMLLNFFGNKIGINLVNITKYLPGALYKNLIVTVNMTSNLFGMGDFSNIFKSIIGIIRFDVGILLIYMIIFTTISFVVFNKKDFI